MARGFAYIGADGIDVSTVSPTATGAKVKAIVRLSAGAVIPRDNWDEETIDQWLGRVMSRLHKRGQIVEVRIELAS